MARRNIGIDVGGTNSVIGIVDDDGTVLDHVTLPTKGADDPARFTVHLYEETQAILKKNGLSLGDIEFIGMGVPGTVDTATGFVQFCANIPWVDVPLGDHMLQAFGRKVVIDHDVRLAALAEMLFGAGQGFTDILCVVIGTGIGAGIISGGTILHGASNTAGEMGHMIIQKNGRPCNCGQKGCLERYSSGTGIIERALEVMDSKDFDGRPQTTKTVFDLAREGNPTALQVTEESIEYLALGIVNAVNLLSPQVVIVGGGVAMNGDIFFDPLREYVYRYGFYSWVNQNKLEIRQAGLTDQAAMIGASVSQKIALLQ